VTATAEADYERAGFHISLDPHGALAITALSKPASQRSDLPLPGEEVRSERRVVIQCALNVALFGPKGSIIIDPTEQGWVVHRSEFGTPISVRLIAGGRKLFRYGLWLIDVVQGLDKMTTRLSAVGSGKAFSIAQKREFLVIDRRFEHVLPDYRSRYSARIQSEGAVTLVLKKRGFALFPPGQGLRLDEVLVKAGIPGFFVRGFRAASPPVGVDGSGVGEHTEHFVVHYWRLIAPRHHEPMKARNESTICRSGW
jgi:hypothetical protein